MMRTRPQNSRSFGLGTGAGECGSSIPRFAVSSLTTREFRWLHPEAWNDEHKERFLALRQGPASGLYAPPPFVHARRRIPPMKVGQWLLETDDGGVLAVVEAEVLQSHFNTLQIVVSKCCGDLGWREPLATRALSFVISGLAIMTKADVVRVVPLTRAIAAELAGFGWGTTQEVEAFVAQSATLVPFRLKTLTIDPHQWWEVEPGKSDRVALGYLEKRIKFEDEKNEKPERRQRPGLFGLLSKLIRWN